MRPEIDPRRGDIEDDASSSKRRSLLSLAGSLLAEISLPNWPSPWMLLIVFPGRCSGSRRSSPRSGSTSCPTGLHRRWPSLVCDPAGGTRRARLVRWPADISTCRAQLLVPNALAVQPLYAGCRETLRHLVARRLSPDATRIQRSRLHATTAVMSGVVICGIALLALMLVSAKLAFAERYRDLELTEAPGNGGAGQQCRAGKRLCRGGRAGVGGRRCDHGSAHDLEAFDTRPDEARTWRIAHLSDIHVVGERYGFRIESGRSGPRGNERLRRVFASCEILHADDPLHAILITGDMTDAAGPPVG